jgi:hypothetical protein
MQHVDLSADDIRDLTPLKRLLRKSPFSPEARRWKELLAKLDGEAIKPPEPAPPPKVYARRATADV